MFEYIIFSPFLLKARLHKQTSTFPGWVFVTTRAAFFLNIYQDPNYVYHLIYSVKKTPNRVKQRGIFMRRYIVYIICYMYGIYLESFIV